jgi:hypothetical protein
MPQESIDEVKKQMESQSKELIYTNYFLNGDSEPLEYAITIKVDGDEMVISVIDRSQYQK